MTDDGERRRIPGLVGIQRGEAGSEQQLVTFAKRHVESIGYDHEGVPGGYAASAFDEAQVPLRHAGLQRELHLAEAPHASPCFQDPAELACGTSCLSGHVIYRMGRRQLCPTPVSLPKGVLPT